MAGDHSSRRFKPSLRRLPSTLFTREAKGLAASPGSRSPARSGAHADSKVKRKGLANILGFGSTRFANAPPVPHIPASLSIPQEGLACFGTVEPQSRARPSCGPDPFYNGNCGAHGAHVSFSPDLDRVSRKGSSRSASCSPARPTGACGIAAISIDDFDDFDDPLASTDDTDELDSASPRASIPVSSSHTPSRLSDAPRMLALAEVDESADIAARNGPTEQLAPQTLKKGKHRSHVWGWFESKRKSKLADGSDDSNVNRPPLPSVHVTHPSLDSGTGPTTVPLADCDSFGATTSFARSALPRRKSLTGLFGLALKKSHDMLRPSTPSPSLKVEAAPPRTHPRARSDLFKNPIASPDMVDPDTVYERRLSDSFMAEGSFLDPDLSIGEVTTVTSQLEELLSNEDQTPSRLSFFRPTRRRGSCGASGAQLVSSPFRTPRKAAPSPKRPQHGADSTPKAKQGSPSPVRSKVKRGMRNIFAPVSPSAKLPSPGPSVETREMLIKSRATVANASSFSIDSDNVFIVGTSPSQQGAHEEQLTEHQLRSLNLPTVRHSRNGSKPPRISLEFDNSSRSSLSWFPAYLRRGGSSTSEQSFNFDQTLAGLNSGVPPRASFLEALSFTPLLDANDSSPFKPLPVLSEEYHQRASKRSLGSKASRRNLTALPQPAPPFRGQLAFQKFIEQTKAWPADQVLRPSGPPPPFALPLPPASSRLRGHGKDDSVVSLATMSSFGGLVDIPSREYPTYFDMAFGPPEVPSLPTVSRSARRRAVFEHHGARIRHERRRCNTAESVEVSLLSGSATASATSLGRQVSTDSTIGRTDWAAQRRLSYDSVNFAQLGRPGLGDRMFQVDSNVALGESTRSGDTGPSTATVRLSYGSEWSSCDPRSDSDSLFATVEEQDASVFWLKGVRPISEVSDESSNVHVDDTFDGHAPRPSPYGMGVIESYMADSPIMSKTRSSSLLPQHRARRAKPPMLNLEPELDTPGLTSPSSVDESSFETKGSAPPVINLARVRAHGLQKASITDVVQIHPTIKEEPSMSTLRSGTMERSRLSLEPPADAWELGDCADFYGQCDSSAWDVAISNKHELPRTRRELGDFLQQSSQMYQPLTQNVPRRVAPRRPPTFKMTRASSSPYSMVLPPPVTRYKNKRDSTSSDDNGSPLISPLLTEFARDRTPSPLPVPVDNLDELEVPVTSETRHVSPSTRRRNLGWSRRRDSDPSVSTQELAIPVPLKAPSTVGTTFPSFIAFPPTPKTHSLTAKSDPLLQSLGCVDADEESKPALSRVSSRPRAPSVVVKPKPKRLSSGPLSQLPTRSNLIPKATTAVTKSTAFRVAVDRPTLNKVKSSPEMRTHGIPILKTQTRSIATYRPSALPRPLRV